MQWLRSEFFEILGQPLQLIQNPLGNRFVKSSELIGSIGKELNLIAHHQFRPAFSATSAAVMPCNPCWERARERLSRSLISSRSSSP